LPDLPPRIRELLEMGVTLEVASAGRSSSKPIGYASTLTPGPELHALLDMLGQEQLIRREEGKASGAPDKGDGGDLVMLIPAGKSRRVGAKSDSSELGALSAATVLRRAPRVVVDLAAGRAVVSTGSARGVDGGPRALQLLHAFESPRTVQEVIRVLQGRVGEVRGWIDLLEALVRLYEAGVLRSVKKEERPYRGVQASQVASSKEW
jgi:hypothetical protein